MLRKIKKLETIPTPTPFYFDKETGEFSFKIPNKKGDDYYVVSNNHNQLLRCTCKDYEINGVGKREGSYTCKHILKVLQMLLMEAEQ